MAFNDNLKPSEASAEKKGTKRKNWKNKIQFLLNRNTQFRPNLVRRKAFRPSTDDVKQWAQSLDKLLAHKYGRAAFRIFLKSEFCEENIEFWTACEEFKLLTSHADRVSKANSIYEEFIQTEAAKEINLDCKTKDDITRSLQDPTAASFLAAQKKVYSLMDNNAYPRFIQSELYKEICAAASGEEKHIKS